ncbi:hypothetical protein RvY_06949-2 [Ramazzottius varieornatus]|uniref:Uncharacterized protein n=1 Tax=Ramazzottius varieornatus TaxID=947166 RepID=A0A1D1V349_RAMVA|nr:hypothetical protein RvY_06949-2 [Ramazzottius varieornatus]
MAEAQTLERHKENSCHWSVPTDPRRKPHAPAQQSQDRLPPPTVPRHATFQPGPTVHFCSAPPVAQFRPPPPPMPFPRGFPPHSHVVVHHHIMPLPPMFAAPPFQPPFICLPSPAQLLDRPLVRPPAPVIPATGGGHSSTHGTEKNRAEKEGDCAKKDELQEKAERLEREISKVIREAAIKLYQVEVGSVGKEAEKPNKTVEVPAPKKRQRPVVRKEVRVRRPALTAEGSSVSKIQASHSKNKLLQ